MYLTEQSLGRVEHFVKNRAHAKGLITKVYVGLEYLIFCSMYLRGIETRFNLREKIIMLKRDNHR